MRDYWLVKYVLSAIGWAYIIISLGAIGLALRYAKPRKAKITTTLVVVAIFSILPLLGFKQHLQEQRVADEFQARFAKAKRLFDERCKTAGEKIYRTVEDVEGIQLLNLRSGDKASNRANPNWPDAALPSDATGMGYIQYFLEWEYNDKSNPRGFPTSDSSRATSRGYRFVDVKQADGTFLRYRLNKPKDTGLVSEPLTGKPARYALGSENHVDPADRAQWVAGVTITVTDTDTGETIAQKIAYSFEPGLGNTAGERMPWAFAVSCPAWRGWDGARTRFFVDQILKPKQGE
jgi:hypothetical protein